MKFIFLFCNECQNEVEVGVDADNPIFCPECRTIDNFNEVNNKEGEKMNHAIIDCTDEKKEYHRRLESELLEFRDSMRIHSGKVFKSGQIKGFQAAIQIIEEIDNFAAPDEIIKELSRYLARLEK